MSAAFRNRKHQWHFSSGEVPKPLLQQTWLPVQDPLNLAKIIENSMTDPPQSEQLQSQNASAAIPVILSPDGPHQESKANTSAPTSFNTPQGRIDSSLQSFAVEILPPSLGVGGNGLPGASINSEQPLPMSASSLGLEEARQGGPVVSEEKRAAVSLVKPIKQLKKGGMRAILGRRSTQIPAADNPARPTIELTPPSQSALPVVCSSFPSCPVLSSPLNGYAKVCSH